MKTLPLTLSLLLATGAAFVQAGQDDPMRLEARGLVKQFGGQLKGEVGKGMKAGGPVSTIEICSVKAPQIAADIASSSGWSVGRTSLKLRNPNNAPDAWEQAVLEQFEARKAAGEPVAKLEFAETVTTEGSKQYRYMKAIGTEPVCLNCHAAEIKPAVETRLSELYPQDKARGFAIGDIRGAFTLSKDL